MTDIQQLCTEIQCSNIELIEIAEDFEFNYETENLLFEMLDIEIINRRKHVFQLMNSLSQRKFDQFMQRVGYV